MAVLQVPSGSISRRIDGRILLALGTALAAAGYLVAGFSGTLRGLCIALILAGAGSSTQHPIGSAAVSRAYGAKSRGPLGVFNFSGDLGKAALPVLVSLLLTTMHWRIALRLIAALGFAVALVVLLFMPGTNRATKTVNEPKSQSHGKGRGGFRLLFAIGVLDTSARMGLLIFLPFLLKAKGAGLPVVGIALGMVFIGGAAGKFACGWLGARIGVLWTVFATEGGTAAAILLILALPLFPALALLPLLGVMLNGTSSVLYGTVPELTADEKVEQLFALFYTGTIGSGAIAPIFFGMMGDRIGVPWATAATALTALATLPFAIALAPHLRTD
jgi:MFS family permease